MNKSIKRKWVAALLSGEYEQGSYWLCKDGKFCCLGVLDKACGLNSGGSRSLPSSVGTAVFGGDEEEVQSQLADLNDSGVPFDMIAGLIEEAL